MNPSQDQLGDPVDLAVAPPTPPPEPAGTLIQSNEARQASSLASAQGDSRFPLIPGYIVEKQLGRGGMAVVYRARQLGLNRTVALKVVQPGRLSHPGALPRFEREVQAAARLSHPQIVTVFHTDLTGTPCYLAMEYVPGIDLQRLVAEDGPRPVADAVEYARQAAVGLQHLHAQGLVHRDIKPGNLMVSPAPTDPAARAEPPAIKILDMGLARLTWAIEESDSAGSLTQADEFLGTPDYSRRSRPTPPGWRASAATCTASGGRCSSC
jgi:serine/threonine protein kinase